MSGKIALGLMAGYVAVRVGAKAAKAANNAIDALSSDKKNEAPPSHLPNGLPNSLRRRDHALALAMGPRGMAKLEHLAGSSVAWLENLEAGMKIRHKGLLRSAYDAGGAAFRKLAEEMRTSQGRFASLQGKNHHQPPQVHDSPEELSFMSKPEFVEQWLQSDDLKGMLSSPGGMERALARPELQAMLKDPDSAKMIQDEAVRLNAELGDKSLVADPVSLLQAGNLPPAVSSTPSNLAEALADFQSPASTPEPAPAQTTHKPRPAPVSKATTEAAAKAAAEKAKAAKQAETAKQTEAAKEAEAAMQAEEAEEAAIAKALEQRIAKYTTKEGAEEFVATKGMLYLMSNSQAMDEAKQDPAYHAMREHAASKPVIEAEVKRVNQLSTEQIEAELKALAAPPDGEATVDDPVTTAAATPTPTQTPVPVQEEAASLKDEAEVQAAPEDKTAATVATPTPTPQPAVATPLAAEPQAKAPTDESALASTTTTTTTPATPKPEKKVSTPPSKEKSAAAEEAAIRSAIPDIVKDPASFKPWVEAGGMEKTLDLGMKDPAIFQRADVRAMLADDGVKTQVQERFRTWLAQQEDAGPERLAELAALAGMTPTAMPTTPQTVDEKPVPNVPPPPPQATVSVH